jgi:hypothetical protein
MPTSLRDRRARPGPARRLRSAVHAARTPQERVLALQRAIGNRGTRRLLARAPVNPTREELPLGEYDDAGTQKWPLLYRDMYGSTEDEDGYVNWRQIAEDDPEFEADYIDYNIVNATVLVTLDTGEYDAIKVHYKDGRTRTFAKSDIPNPKYTRMYKRRGQSRTPRLDAFEKREEESTQDPFIYPDVQGRDRAEPVPRAEPARSASRRTSSRRSWPSCGSWRTSPASSRPSSPCTGPWPARRAPRARASSASPASATAVW